MTIARPVLYAERVPVETFLLLERLFGVEILIRGRSSPGVVYIGGPPAIGHASDDAELRSHAAALMSGITSLDKGARLFIEPVDTISQLTKAQAEVIARECIANPYENAAEFTCLAAAEEHELFWILYFKAVADDMFQIGVLVDKKNEVAFIRRVVDLTMKGWTFRELSKIK